MLWMIALVVILVGLLLIISGLREGERFSPYVVEEREEELEEEEKRKVSGGGVILIGPIPIVFGDSRYAVVALALSILLMLMAILFILLPYALHA